MINPSKIGGRTDYQKMTAGYRGPSHKKITDTQKHLLLQRQKKEGDQGLLPLNLSSTSSSDQPTDPSRVRLTPSQVQTMPLRFDHWSVAKLVAPGLTELMPLELD